MADKIVEINKLRDFDPLAICPKTGHYPLPH